MDIAVAVLVLRLRLPCYQELPGHVAVILKHPPAWWIVVVLLEPLDEIVVWWQEWVDDVAGYDDMTNGSSARYADHQPNEDGPTTSASQLLSSARSKYGLSAVEKNILCWRSGPSERFPRASAMSTALLPRVPPAVTTKATFSAPWPMSTRLKLSIATR